MMQPALIGAAGAVVTITVILWAIGGRKSLWRAFIYAGWMCMALYSFGSSPDFNPAVSIWYGIFAAIGAAVSACVAFVRRRHRTANA